MALIEVKNLKKYFPVSSGILHAVDNVSMEIEETKTMGIVGESGCGKSTLGKTVLRMLAPTSGQVLFDGTDIMSFGRREAHEMHTKMQMIFQDPYSSLDPRKSITQIIAEPIKIFKRASGKKDLNRQVKDLMDTVGIASRYANAYPHELDGGRRQRVGIARALALNPRFIVCDEPVSALDVSIQAQVLNLLRELQHDKGLTYMFITHDLSVVKYISDDICVMYLGQVVEKCETKRLFKNPSHPYTQALLSAILEPDITKKTNRIILQGELSSPINPPKYCRFAPRCRYATDECFESEPELKDIGDGHLVKCHKVEAAKS